MDVRAFGSYYGQTSQLPYASGFGYVAASGIKRFPACRALFIEADANQNKGYLALELTDAPGQILTADNLIGNQLIAISCTAVISGNLPAVFILY
jgi:hypothetical protein